MNLIIDLKLETEEKQRLNEALLVMIERGLGRDEVTEGQLSPLEKMRNQLFEDNITLSQDEWDLISVTFFANSLNPNQSRYPKELLMELSELIGNLLEESGFSLE